MLIVTPLGCISTRRGNMYFYASNYTAIPLLKQDQKGGNSLSSIVITSAGLNLLRDGVSGANNSKFLYFAVGSSSTAPSVSDTQLGAETFRKAVTSYTNGGSTGEIIVSAYLGPTDAVGLDIEEVGVFGGNAATTALNSGVLIAHGLFSHNPKTGTESIVLQFDLTI